MEKFKSFRLIFLLTFSFLFIVSGVLYAQSADDVIDKTVNNLTWRSIGPDWIAFTVLVKSVAPVAGNRRTSGLSFARCHVIGGAVAAASS